MTSVRAAVELIDVRSHRGVHPRVGAADVVPIVPLDSTPLSFCSEVAAELGERIWSELKVPVYFYGRGQSLADIRGGRGRLDLGGPDLHPTAGAVCVGARPKLVAFNVVLRGVDVVAARSLARSLRESGGGMRGVHALVFELSDGRVQLSMNLFRLEETTPAMVIDELGRRGVSIASEHVVGLCPAVVSTAAAAGRLLEARLGAAAARAGAARCLERGGEEHIALALRLHRESEGMAQLGVDQEALLAGAERAAALVPVLKVAGVFDDELLAMLGIAASGLFRAVDAETRSAFAARVVALERRLAATN
ncbi:MAG: glutamate formiminotransferase / formiminotetrahydrofolate cyclodeaminase [Chloroflexota bacterium]|nr:glutamate formiminotransferase / formiminotetrahydrofolate cyclodeaminase [Chloroflexota bacterium]